LRFRVSLDVPLRRPKVPVTGQNLHAAQASPTAKIFLAVLVMKVLRPL
jgi:hypothetical protein